MSFKMKKKRKLLRRFLAVTALLSIYPLCVLAFTWSHVLKSDLQGGRHGQLDAYRHALASATVSYTLGDWAVNLVSAIFEWNNKDSNKMDIHNNRVGASIGSRVKSFRDIEPTVRQSVKTGTVNATDTNQITWLPTDLWRDEKLW